jgi:DnaJ-class molecular chaperone
MTGFKNMYSVLELPDYADADAVKSAYRRLARQHHPDLNRDNAKHSEEILKTINAAYEVLSDPSKRAFHDRQLQIQDGSRRSTSHKTHTASHTSEARAHAEAKAHAETPKTAPPPQKSNTGNPPPNSSTQQARVDVTSQSDVPKNKAAQDKKPDTSGNSFSELLDDWLGKAQSKKSEPKAAPPPPYASDPSILEADPQHWKKHDSASSRQEKEKPKRGEDVHVKTAITQDEAGQGVIKTIHVQHVETCRRCSGTGRVNGTACSACYGEKTHTRTRKMDIRIPAGVKTGSKVRVAKEGGRGTAGGEAGDLFLQIEITSDPGLRIEGVDVHSDITISPAEAALGTNIEVTTISGPYTMTIPPGTQSGRIFRLKELGVKHGLAQGDHFVTVNLHIPESLSAREKELYQELAKLEANKKSKT